MVARVAESERNCDEALNEKGEFAMTQTPR